MTTLKAGYPSSRSWAIARLIRPLDAKFTRSDLVIQALRPWRIFLGWREGDNPELTDTLDNAVLKKAEVPHSYAVQSRTEVIFTLVGPPISRSTADPNVRVSWGGIDASLLRVVVGLGRKENVIVAVDRTRFAADWGQVCVPLKNRGLPPKPGYHGPWSGIEVHTNRYCEISNIRMRIEHHDPNRVPSSAYWKSQSKGGYARADPNALASQAQAAVAWQLAVREVMTDSRYGAISQHFGHVVTTMGFETNNPLHDDHSGRGAHWHLGVTPKKKYKTPHLYLKENGRIDLKKTMEADNCEGAYDLGAFGFRICPPDGKNDGDLILGRIVTVQAKSRMYLHVRESKQGLRDPVALWDKMDNEGSRWLMCWNENGSQGGSAKLAFCSVRSNQFLHIRKSKSGERDGVAQWNKDDPGNWWRFDGDGRLQSCRSGLYLNAPMNQQNRSVPRQTASKACQSAWKGVVYSTHWKVKHSGGSFGGSTSSYRIRVRAPPPHTPSKGGANAKIWRNGQLWIHFTCVDDAQKGELEMKRCLGREAAPSTQFKMSYDPSTGNGQASASTTTSLTAPIKSTSKTSGSTSTSTTRSATTPSLPTRSTRDSTTDR